MKKSSTKDGFDSGNRLDICNAIIDIEGVVFSHIVYHVVF